MSHIKEIISLLGEASGEFIVLGYLAYRLIKGKGWGGLSDPDYYRRVKRKSNALKQYYRSYDYGEYSEALSHLNQHLSEYERDGIAYYQKAKLLIKLEEELKAIEALQKAVVIEPKWYKPRVRLTEYYLKFGHVDKAVHEGRKAVKLHANSETQFQLGCAYFHEGSYRDAIEHLENALEDVDADRERIVPVLNKDRMAVKTI